jgi:hypothetical protein
MSSYPKAVVAVLFAWLAAPGTVTAQLSRPQFGVGAGVTFASGDFNSLWGFNRGWQGTAFVAFRIRHSPVAFRLGGSYGASTSSEPINGDPTKNRVELLGGDADVTLTFPSPSRAKFYLLGGPGLYRLSQTITRQSQGTSSSEETKFAYNLGGGVTVGALFFEARYVHVDGFGNSLSWGMVPITAGVRFGGW